MVLILVKFTL